MKQTLEPSIYDLRSEFVLVQAWKKTVADIRARSWYSDTLEIDYQSLRLPEFIREIQEKLESPENWKLTDLKIVPAPKNQEWWINAKEEWCPKEAKDASAKLRPLAHVDLKDQVVATAIMLCIADEVETYMGDPRLNVGFKENRREVLSYGHRLFCDSDEESGELRHRWGSSKLFRQYYQDYQTFLDRPKVVSKQLKSLIPSKFEIAVIHSDLSKFYDRIDTKLVRQKIHDFCDTSVEGGVEFKALVDRFFDWRWEDERRAQKFMETNSVENFLQVALPQGLTSAGFFANIALTDLEDAMRSSIGREIAQIEGESVTLLDICYYVDDLRIVTTIPRGSEVDIIFSAVTGWLQQLLDEHAIGLQVQKNKTQVIIEDREERFLVQQSQAANRIQSEVSGTFDMLHGTELIGAIEGFFHTQMRYPSASSPEKTGRSGLLVGMSDMKDDTAARFAAGRYRKTFRSLRPLLEGARSTKENAQRDSYDTQFKELILSKEQLDEKAKSFAALLIEEWIRNPGNVRLLRIALDMYPDAHFLQKVLKLLEPGWTSSKRGARIHRREVELYCLTEIFRAGATETAIVEDEDCLPNDINPNHYHEVLTECATAIFNVFVETGGRNKSRHPWYLMQQVFLYLAARDALPESSYKLKEKGGAILQRYRKLADFLNGNLPATNEARAIYIGISVSGFGNQRILDILTNDGVSSDLISELTRISPTLADEVITKQSDDETLMNSAIRHGLRFHKNNKFKTVASLATRKKNPFFDEQNLLELAVWLFCRPIAEFEKGITPWDIRCSTKKSVGFEFGKLNAQSLELVRGNHTFGSMFSTPEWCNNPKDRKRYSIGLILRHAIKGYVSIFENHATKKIPSYLKYNKPITHWEQQRYSLFHGRSSLGMPWLPIGSETEELLFELLRWPGCGRLLKSKSLKALEDFAISALDGRKKSRGEFTSEIFLSHDSKWPEKDALGSRKKRKLRIGVVQSITPSFNDFKAHQNDPELNDRIIRHKHRRHLASIIEGVTQMLRVRETHRSYGRGNHERLDLLVFPELAIHPDDIKPHILPFIRKYKCMVLFGVVYHPLLPNSNRLINSALWMIPRWDRNTGLQVDYLEQGKKRLAPEERGFFNPSPVGFRPAQWIVKYHWHQDSANHRPLNISASVCYDATDLALASDLSSRSDLYIICALNKDVGTFDRMSEGLHYHMFQGIIIVNNGQFGGSNFYLPFKNQYERQVFHIHGQPQASISFAEISPHKMITRPNSKFGFPKGEWKSPPASWKPVI